MTVSRFALAASSLLLLSSLTVSSLADIRPLESSASMPASGGSSNPIRLEGQVRELTRTGDTVIIRLHRDRYPIVATRVTRVRWLAGRRARATDLQTGDSIRVEGNLEQNEIVADRVTILLRMGHRPPAPRETSRLVISFYSIASGPVRSDVEAVDSLLRQYEADHHVTLEKTRSAYGMEGDFAYCFALAELGAREQADLVETIRSFAKSLRQVNVAENEPCPGRTQ